MRNGIALCCAYDPTNDFIWALDTKKQELTDIEVTAGVGKKLLIYTL